jgi:cell filamentation protein, protein adenylyltransferase
MPLSTAEAATLTFVPNALPPKLELTNELFNATSDVANAMGRLEGTARALPDPKILIRSFVRREAQLSSYIENTFARYEEVAAADQARGRPIPSDDARETLNAEHAIEVGVEAVFKNGRPITNSLLRQIHSVLVRGARGEECAGHFRAKQVYIGNALDGIRHARFVPPPPHLLNDLMEAFERYVKKPDALPALIQIALVHYQLETIHPFEDGNGRLGRILVLLGLCQHGLLTVPLINASLHFERNKQEYYDALLNVSTVGDWSGWILFFLEGLRVAAVESMQKLTELTDLQRRYHDRLRSARNTALLLTLADNLFVSPVVTISDAARIMGVTYQAAQNSVRKLVDAKILRLRPRDVPATFVAEEILRAVNPMPTSR